MNTPRPQHADFACAAPANDAAGLPLALSIFADRPQLRCEMREDALAAGFRVAEVSCVSSLLEGEARALGEVVLLDCPEVDGAALAALARLDMRAAHCGAHLIVSTSVDALDDVFACMDQSGPQLLVDPTRADRTIALGRVLSRFPNLPLRKMTEEDRMLLLRLTEQVSRIAERLERLAEPAEGNGVFRLEAPRLGWSGGEGDGSQSLVRAPLSDPRLVRSIIRRRRLRARFFDDELFADPAWDMLLDLTAARAERARISVTSLCIASAVPPTTALRWIGQMTEAGLFERVDDETDRRRAFIALSDRAADAMARYFAELGKDAAPPV
jgi:hypothetical protein